MILSKWKSMDDKTASLTQQSRDDRGTQTIGRLEPPLWEGLGHGRLSIFRVETLLLVTPHIAGTLNWIELDFPR